MSAQEPDPTGPRPTSWLGTAGILARHLPDLVRDYAYALRHQVPWLPDPPLEGAAADATGTTIVVLPGIWEPTYYLRPLTAHLRHAGHDVRVLTSLQENLREPSQAATRVARLLGAEDLHDVVLVAHSKGGLVAKTLLLDPSTGTRVAGAVCVCTPFSGSQWGPLFLPGLGIRNLAPRGRVVTALATQTAVNARITSVYPTADPHVPEGSFLAGATNVEIDAFGHNQVLSDPRFVDAVLRAVDGYRVPRVE